MTTWEKSVVYTWKSVRVDCDLRIDIVYRYSFYSVNIYRWNESICDFSFSEKIGTYKTLDYAKKESEEYVRNRFKNDNMCGCIIEDIAPCGNICDGCMPAYKSRASPCTGFDFIMKPSRKVDHE